MAIFMPAVESSIVATALPTIIGHLGGFHLFSWVFAVPFLTMAVTIPLYGRLADIYGRRRVFFTGTAIFLIGTTLCGFARSMELLIVFRAIQGIGAGAIQPIAVTIIGDVYTPAERARIQGAMSAVWGFAAVVGPAVSAFIVETRALVGRVLGQPADRISSASRCSRCFSASGSSGASIASTISAARC